MRSNMDLRTPTEEIASSELNPEIPTKQKKLRPGRQNKHVADYCLLAGSHVDAVKQ